MDHATAEQLRESIAVWVADPAEVERLVTHADTVAHAAEARLAKVGPTEGLGDRILEQIALNLADKRDFSVAVSPLPMSARTLERTVIDWEVFKAESTITGGVYPRRYFGYVDELADSAAYETRMRIASTQAADAVNGWLEEQGDPLRITPLEITTTWLAEGGALYMRDDPDRLDRLHPVFDVGLDDIASGFSELPGLQERVDRELGTHLGGVVAWVEAGGSGPASSVPESVRWVRNKHGDDGPYSYLTRSFTFEEAIAATALMWTWELQIAQRKLKEGGLAPLQERRADEKFIIGSLVYNSGRLHSPGTWAAIENYTNADKLVTISADNATRRQVLPVVRPVEMLATLRGGGGYVDQNTSWLGQYHVAQRWGGYVGLTRYTDRFTEQGRYVESYPAPPAEAWPRLPELAPAATATKPGPPAPALPVEPVRTSWWSPTRLFAAVAAGLLVVAAGLGVVRASRRSAFVDA